MAGSAKVRKEKKARRITPDQGPPKAADRPSVSGKAILWAQEGQTGRANLATQVCQSQPPTQTMGVGLGEPKGKERSQEGRGLGGHSQKNLNPLTVGQTTPEHCLWEAKIKEQWVTPRR